MSGVAGELQPGGEGGPGGETEPGAVGGGDSPSLDRAELWAGTEGAEGTD